MNASWLPLAVGGILTVSAGVASAQARDDRGWFLEASVLEVDSSGNAETSFLPVTSSVPFPFAGENPGFAIKGSYAFTRLFGLQAGYYDFGEHSAWQGCPFGMACATVVLPPVRVHMAGLSLAAVGTWHATERVELFGKLGILRGEVDFGRVPDDRDSGMLRGAGVGVWLTERWRLDAQYERVDFDFESAGIGATYRF
jgi:opacity protein-like surface antigen